MKQLIVLLLLTGSMYAQAQVYVYGEPIEDAKYITAELVRTMGVAGFQVVVEYGQKQKGAKQRKLTDATGKKLAFWGFGSLCNYMDKAGYEYIDSINYVMAENARIGLNANETHLVFVKKE